MELAGTSAAGVEEEGEGGREGGEDVITLEATQERGPGAGGSRGESDGGGGGLGGLVAVRGHTPSGRRVSQVSPGGSSRGSSRVEGRRWGTAGQGQSRPGSGGTAVSGMSSMVGPEDVGVRARS